MIPLSPLLLECARPQPDSSALRAHASAGAGWEVVVAQAVSHGIAPLLYWELRRHCGDLVPKSILADLCASFRRNACRNLVLDSELLRLVAVFEKAGIDVLAFKGPALSWTLYEDPALREMSDLDLLVRPRDARRAYELLISEGYESAYPSLHWRFLQTYNNEVPLTRGGVAIDLHWETLPRCFPLARDTEAAWSRSRRVSLANGSVPTFSTEDLFAFLCVHGGKHGWTQLSLLADVSRLVTREAIDWPVVLERARATGSCTAVSLALALMLDLLSLPIPAAAAAMVDRDHIAQQLADKVRHALLAGSDGPSGTLSQMRFWLALSTGPLSKARVLLQPLQPQIADQLWWRLPTWLSPMYYVTRPIRLAAKHGCRLLENKHAVLLILWAVLICCVVAGSLLSAASPVIAAVGLLHVSDLVLHFVAYLALAFLPLIGFRYKRRGIVAGLSMFVLGVLLEAGQYFSAGRAVEFADVLANGAGVGCGLVFAFPIRSRIANPSARLDTATPNSVPRS